MKKITVLPFLLTLLTGCATTYYGGTSEVAIAHQDQEQSIVKFRGNTSVDSIQANKYLILKSAEVSLQRGYDYFVVSDIDDNSANYIDGYSTSGVGATGISKAVLGENSPITAITGVIDASTQSTKVTRVYSGNLEWMLDFYKTYEEVPKGSRYFMAKTIKDDEDSYLTFKDRYLRDQPEKSRFGVFAGTDILPIVGLLFGEYKLFHYLEGGVYYEWLPFRWFSLVPEFSLAIHYESWEISEPVYDKNGNWEWGYKTKRDLSLFLLPGMSLRLNYKKYYLYGKISVFVPYDDAFMGGFGLGYRWAENMHFEMGFSLETRNIYDDDDYNNDIMVIPIRVLIPF